MSNTKKIYRFTIAMTLCLGSILAFAHHSASHFDENRHIELQGRIIELDYRNPHIEMMIHVGVDDPNTAELEGQVWEVETVSATTAHRRGMYAETLRVGNPIQVRGWAAKDGGHEIFVSSITLFDDPEMVLLIWQEGAKAGSLATDVNVSSEAEELVADAELEEDTEVADVELEEDAEVADVELEEDIEVATVNDASPVLDNSALINVTTYVLRDRL